MAIITTIEGIIPLPDTTVSCYHEGVTQPLWLLHSRTSYMGLSVTVIIRHCLDRDQVYFVNVTTLTVQSVQIPLHPLTMLICGNTRLLFIIRLFSIFGQSLFTFNPRCLSRVHAWVTITRYRGLSLHNTIAESSMMPWRILFEADIYTRPIIDPVLRYPWLRSWDAASRYLLVLTIFAVILCVCVWWMCILTQKCSMVRLYPYWRRGKIRRVVWFFTPNARMRLSWNCSTGATTESSR